MLTDACDRNPMLTSLGADAAAGQFKFCGFLLPSYVSCPMVRVRMMTDFHRNLRRGRRSASASRTLNCVSLFPANAIFSFPLDWNSRHAALKKNLIGDPSGPDSITSSHAHGGSRPPAMRFPGPKLTSGTVFIKGVMDAKLSIRHRGD